MVCKLFPKKEGFCPVAETEKFKCAFITRDAQYVYGEVIQMKRHNDSGEVFTLVSGNATLLTLEEDFVETPLEKGCAYMVAAGTWHYLAVSEDAVIFVTENSGMLPQNTDVLTLKEPYTIK